MINIRVISLDLDDTLWPVAPVIAAAESALVAWITTHHPAAMVDHDVASMRAMRIRIAAEVPGQSHDLTFLRRRALAEQFSAAGYADGPVEEALEIYLSMRNRVQLYDDVRPALARLRRKYKLFAVSNGNADLARCGIADLFDGHVTAAAAGAAKPDPRIFAHLVRVSGVAAAEILHVGDDPYADVVGAVHAGLQSAWLNRDAQEWPPQLEPALHTVASLADLN